ncbi:MAG: RDD family protein [Beijerinckiaceae bacterium]
MSETQGYARPFPQPAYSLPPVLPHEALAGVRTRRILALCLDFVVVGILAAAIWLALLIMTFGLTLFFLPPIFPFVAFFYNGFSVSGRKMGTPGMRMMDLQMQLAGSGGRVPFIVAAIHAVLFYFSWMFPPIFLVSIVTHDKRCLHDIFSGVIVLRRPY